MISSGELAKFMLNHVHSISCVDPYISFDSDFVKMIRKMEFVNCVVTEDPDVTYINATFNGHYLIEPQSIMFDETDKIKFQYVVFLDLLDYIEGQLGQ